jgi:hypothetical protein
MMTSIHALAVGVLVLASAMIGGDTVTMRGWLSDQGCAQAKVKGEEVTPNNTICVKKCLDEGATPVFVNPRGKALYELRDYPTLREDVGYHLELTGVVDEKAKTISVRNVKRLAEIVNVCALPKKK